MEVGASKTVRIPVDEAYGTRRDDLVLEVPGAAARRPRGRRRGAAARCSARTASVPAGHRRRRRRGRVTLDANHPLAGPGPHLRAPARGDRLSAAPGSGGERRGGRRWARSRSRPPAPLPGPRRRRRRRLVAPRRRRRRGPPRQLGVRGAPGADPLAASSTGRRPGTPRGFARPLPAEPRLARRRAAGDLLRRAATASRRPWLVCAGASGDASRAVRRRPGVRLATTPTRHWRRGLRGRAAVRGGGAAQPAGPAGRPPRVLRAWPTSACGLAVLDGDSWVCSTWPPPRTPGAAATRAGSPPPCSLGRGGRRPRAYLQVAEGNDRGPRPLRGARVPCRVPLRLRRPATRTTRPARGGLSSGRRCGGRPAAGGPCRARGWCR
jgi:hypothetical protein